MKQCQKLSSTEQALNSNEHISWQCYCSPAFNNRDSRHWGCKHFCNRRIPAEVTVTTSPKPRPPPYRDSRSQAPPPVNNAVPSPYRTRYSIQDLPFHVRRKAKRLMAEMMIYHRPYLRNERVYYHHGYQHYRFILNGHGKCQAIALTRDDLDNYEEIGHPEC
uniref:Uncharacterized protein n=1 Tax=Glossina pallidipes TaxID=7398 RepID=A0A1B0A4K0_GLOPL